MEKPLDKPAQDERAEALILGNDQQKRGRPPSVSEAMLRARRDRLNGMFEARWAVVGRNLMQAGTREDIAQALRPLAEFKDPIIHLLLITLPLKTTCEAIQLFRQERRELHRQLSNTPNKQEGCNRLLLEAQDAYSQAFAQFANARDSHKYAWKKRKERKNRKLRNKQAAAAYQKQRKKWHAIAKKAKLEVERRVTELNRCNAKASQVEKRLEALEATFAQSEFLRFLESGRYPVTALNVANAIAGFPEMGWRRSFLLCARMPRDAAAPSVAYTVFETVRQTLERTKPQSPGEAVEHFRKMVFARHKAFSPARSFLKEYWPHFEAAIIKAWQSSSDARALPFRITSRFLEALTGPQRVINPLLEELERSYKPSTRARA